MAQENIENKLADFAEAIRLKAEAQRDKIILETQAQKNAALEEEENRLLAELYENLQQDIAAVKTEQIKEISREKARLKRALYQDREDCLAELLRDAAARLGAFAATDAYDTYFARQIETLAASWSLPGSVIRVRPADMRFAQAIRNVYGECDVVPDETVELGGVILTNTTRGIEADLSLGAALREQRDWFYSHSNFHFE